VAGTSDKSEIQIGYFSKFGDGAADIMPIAGLYKTQVRSLAEYLGIPVVIVQKKSSPRLWDNHLAEEEIGMDYEIIDQILYLLVDKKMQLKDATRKLGIDTKHVNKVKKMIEKSLHKRSPAAIFSL
jgi:NAD+ synthase